MQFSPPPMWPPRRRTAPPAPSPVAVNPPLSPVDVQAVGDQGGPGVVGQGGAVGFELTEVGSFQGHPAVLGVRDDRRPSQGEQCRSEPVGDQRLAGVFQPALLEGHSRQGRVAGDHTFAEEAVGQVDGDGTSEMVEVEGALDSGAAQA